MKKTVEGVVTSISQKTAVVEVLRKKPHPLYKKLMVISKKYKADVSDSSVTVGNRVKIAESRPISKDKHFKIVEVEK